jgi:4-diphosphocytidyl-2-C-methyl-D-erythritol kinase
MLTLKAPAKINWFLKVLGLRDDGFHEIQSLIQKVTLYDILTFEPAEDLVLTTSQDTGSVPPEQNLVYKTAMLLKEKCGVANGAHIHLEKIIPMASGLGGGSSDAAAALTGLNKLWRLNLSQEKLHDFAGQLGSDVPVFLYSSPAFVEGRGEKITPIKTSVQFDILIVKPDVSVSTAWAYGQLRKSYELRVMSYELKNKNTTHIPESNSERSLRGLTNKTEKVDNSKFFIRMLGRAKSSIAGRRDLLSSIKDSFLNDFEAAVTGHFSVIADIKNRLLQAGAIVSLMSGSGSAVFGVFASEKDASKAAAAITDFWTAVVKTVNS